MPCLHTQVCGFWPPTGKLLAEDEFDRFDSNDKPALPVKDEHHAIFYCPAYTYMQGNIFQIFSTALIL